MSNHVPNQNSLEQHVLSESLRVLGALESDARELLDRYEKDEKSYFCHLIDVGYSAAFLIRPINSVEHSQAALSSMCQVISCFKLSSDGHIDSESRSNTSYRPDMTRRCYFTCPHGL